jgi:hypothetical protein
MKGLERSKSIQTKMVNLLTRVNKALINSEESGAEISFANGFKFIVEPNVLTMMNSKIDAELASLPTEMKFSVYGEVIHICVNSNTDMWVAPNGSIIINELVQFIDADHLTEVEKMVCKFEKAADTICTILAA